MLAATTRLAASLATASAITCLNTVLVAATTLAAWPTAASLSLAVPLLQFGVLRFGSPTQATVAEMPTFPYTVSHLPFFLLLLSPASLLLLYLMLIEHAFSALYAALAAF